MLKYVALSSKGSLPGSQRITTMDYLTLLHSCRFTVGHMSLVRMAIKSGGHYAKEYKQSVQPLCAFVQSEPDILTFLQSSLKDQCAIQKAHQIDPVWSDEAEVALQNVVLLPQSLRDFKLSDAEWVRLKRIKAENLKQKNLN